jgi:hypothetical protein
MFMENKLDYNTPRLGMEGLGLKGGIDRSQFPQDKRYVGNEELDLARNNFNQFAIAKLKFNKK